MTPSKGQIGRPRKCDTGPKYYDGKLHQVLVDKLPPEFVRGGRVDTGRLSEATGNARYTIYRWLNEQALSKKAIHSLLEVSGKAKQRGRRGTLTKEDLLPFALGL